MTIEKHSLQPFIFEDSKVLLLGSFPPKKEKWMMNFYYPNFQNDMWRIFGLVFFENKDYFLNEDNKSFNKEKICMFLKNNHIAIGDSAQSVIRHKDNAADKFLEVVEKLDFEKILNDMQECRTIIVTGEKSAEIVQDFFGLMVLPNIGEGTSVVWNSRKITVYRVPSSSRAYPKSVEYKATIYKKVFDLIVNK